MPTLADISFKFWRGTIQRPKPVFDSYTRLGADQVYMQRLKTESKESAIEAGNFFATEAECDAQERALANLLGLPQTLVISDSQTLYGVFLKDYTFTKKSGSGKWLIMYNLVLVVDEKSGVSG